MQKHKKVEIRERGKTLLKEKTSAPLKIPNASTMRIVFFLVDF